MKKENHSRSNHPGFILYRDFLKPRHISQAQAARSLHVSQPTMHLLCNGKTSISPETALRLGKLFKTGGYYWLSLQTIYDLEVAKKKWEKKVNREIKPLKKNVINEGE